MDILKKIPMPDNMKKKEIIDLLLKEEYGYLPPAPYSVTAEVVNCEENFYAGKAILRKILLSCKAEFGEFTFPVYYTFPQLMEKPVPCIIQINFRDNVPDRYQPTEEIIDEGFAIISFGYKDVSSDDGDFSNGLAGVVYPNGRENKFQCGKIGLWAWAAMRVMDYAMTLPELNISRISVAGHSRLGKTALLAGALDERFYCAFSNDSGNSGAALARENDCETIEDIYHTFPFWFCENYKKYMGREDSMPFDQHYLIAANYPHRVYVGSAVNDVWACPKNEYLACVAASSYYEKRNMTGLVHPERIPIENEFFGEGNIGYHLRSGKHFFSRDDWHYFMKYLKLHR